MAGTKMMLRRYGNEVTYWNEQEIIVDQAYLDAGNGLLINLTHPYVMGSKLLDVYFNGEHLLEGGGYEEVNESAIRLDLGTYTGDHPLVGQPVPLLVGDEVYIRTWKAEYRQGAGGGIDDLRFKRLEDEVIEARKYKGGSIPFNSLDDRLDSIQEKAETKTMVFVLNRVFLGLAKLEMRFPFEGQITEVYVSAMTAGKGRTVIKIEKCSQADYDTASNWTDVFGQDLILDANEKSTNTSSTPYSVALPNVTKNDHFRINVAELGEGLEGVTIEIMVTI